MHQSGYAGAFRLISSAELVNYLLAAEIVMLALICIPQTSGAFLPHSRRVWGAIRLKPEEANVARQILAFMSERKREGRQVAVLPEAPILYALAGTEAPSRWYTLLPGILSPAQEDVYVADLNRAAPDYILVTSRKTPEYGADYFGIDYDQKISTGSNRTIALPASLAAFGAMRPAAPWCLALRERGAWPWRPISVNGRERINDGSPHERPFEFRRLCRFL